MIKLDIFHTCRRWRTRRAGGSMVTCRRPYSWGHRRCCASPAAGKSTVSDSLASNLYVPAFQPANARGCQYCCHDGEPYDAVGTTSLQACIGVCLRHPYLLLLPLCRSLMPGPCANIAAVC